MSARSDAWYAIPENQERRKKNMRAYAAALVQLGQRYPDERCRAYRRAQPGRSPFAAQQRSYAAVREAHKVEFRELLTRLREA